MNQLNLIFGFREIHSIEEIRSNIDEKLLLTINIIELCFPVIWGFLSTYVFYQTFAVLVFI